MSEEDRQSGEKRVVSVRFSPEEAKRLRHAAERQGVSVSALVRRSITEGHMSAGVRCPDTGKNQSAFSLSGTFSTWSGSHLQLTGSPELQVSSQ